MLFGLTPMFSRKLGWRDGLVHVSTVGRRPAPAIGGRHRLLLAEFQAIDPAVPRLDEVDAQAPVLLIGVDVLGY